jgi:hypothetical protein
MMDKKVILGGGIGALVILVFALGLLLFLEGIPLDVFSLGENRVVSLIIILLAPIAGGFLAGLVSKSKPRQAGLIAGLTAGFFLLVTWIVMTDFSFETLMSGMVIVFVWVVLARLASTFAHPRR